MVLILLACSPTPDWDTFLVVDGREGEYDLEERTIPELDDPSQMLGSLGDGTLGGNVTVEGGILGLLTGGEQVNVYRGGRPIRVAFDVIDGVATPFDADGIVLWSYYHTISRVSADLTEREVDLGTILPIPFAYQATTPFDLSVAENAAYVGGGNAHRFLLRADPATADLPLAANPMAIRHEFGHAVFQYTVHGDSLTSDPEITFPLTRDLDEGFADMLASLTLDDPDILGASLDGAFVDGRRLDADGTFEVVEGNPYAAGTQFARFVWTLRMQTNPDLAFDVAYRSLQRWADLPGLRQEEGDPEVLVDFARIVLEETATRSPETLSVLCAEFEERFQDFEGADVCNG